MVPLRGDRRPTTTQRSGSVAARSRAGAGAPASGTPLGTTAMRPAREGSAAVSTRAVARELATTARAPSSGAARAVWTGRGRWASASWQ